MSNKSQIVKDEIDVLIASGVRSRTRIYELLVEKTGLKRSTIRRITGEYKKDIIKKIKILGQEGVEPKEEDPYYFIPKKIRMFWNKITQNDFIEVTCSICKKHLGFVQGYGAENPVCVECKSKFPMRKRKK